MERIARFANLHRTLPTWHRVFAYHSSEGQRGAAHVAGAALVAAAEAEQAVKPAGGGVVSRQRTDETHGTA